MLFQFFLRQLCIELDVLDVLLFRPQSLHCLQHCLPCSDHLLNAPPAEPFRFLSRL
jgi:hypothetical protein